MPVGRWRRSARRSMPASPRRRCERRRRRGSPRSTLGLEVELSEALRGGPFDAQGLAAGRGDVLLVGHEPDFSDELARLTGARAKLKKGGLAIVDQGELKALLRPLDLAAIAATG